MNVEKIFLDYTKSYVDDSSECKYKVDHSFRVRDIALEIGKSIGMSDCDMRLLNICGIFHDIGRFEQWKRYKTFVDAKFVSHCEIGYDVLKDSDILDNIDLNEEEKQIVLLVVLKHGLVVLDDDIPDYYKLFIKVIMDADKIDILNNAVSGDISLDIGDDEVSPLVYENMFDHKILDMKKKSTKADRLCVWLAFVYGMHFDYSYKYLKDGRIMSKLIDTYKNKTSNVVTKKQYEKIGNDINLYLGGKYVG